MKAWIVAALMAVMALAAAPAARVARVCAEIGNPPTLDDYKRDSKLRTEALADIRRTQAIFLGVALTSSETSATFKVTRVWQGELTTPLTLRGPVQLQPDGVGVWTSEIASDFKIGASYLVYAIGPSLAEAWPFSCSTALASKSRETIRILDFLTKPYSPRRAER